jgi:hypothetical protein
LNQITVADLVRETRRYCLAVHEQGAEFTILVQGDRPTVALGPLEDAVFDLASKPIVINAADDQPCDYKGEF